PMTTPTPGPGVPITPAAASMPGDVASSLWVDKYKPVGFGDLVGNMKEVAAIDEWLANWHAIHVTSTFLHAHRARCTCTSAARASTTLPFTACVLAETMPKPPFARDNRGATAVLISGPPGIGKTTTALLLARRRGFVAQELNASDARSKNVVKVRGLCAHNCRCGRRRAVTPLNAPPDTAPRHSALLQAMLDGMTDNTVLSFGAPKSVAGSAGEAQRLIIMDEVDGMSAGDRGGNQELIRLIKSTKTPFICICNDDQKPSVRSLSKYCFHVKFFPPTRDMVRARLLKVRACATRHGSSLHSRTRTHAACIVASRSAHCRPPLSSAVCAAFFRRCYQRARPRARTCARMR
ncbi:AAA family ATPase, partial [archaeon]